MLFASTAMATFPGADGRIAFMAGGDIHTIRPNGTDDRTIAHGIWPSWSANGRRIAFDGGARGPGAILTMRADGSGIRFLVHGSGPPSFSPHGGRIVFTRGASDPAANIVSVRSADGGDLRVLARITGPALPKYSPDGRRIVYENGVSLWDMRPDGSHKRRLTRPSGKYEDTFADYSPDGKHIIFQRGPYPYVMRSNGSHVHRVGCGEVYSPSGGKVAWNGALQGGGNEIFTGTTSCAEAFQVTHDALSYEPSWQPLPNG